MKLIIAEPKNMADRDNLKEFVREYEIRLALRVHGAGTRASVIPPP